MSLRNTLQKVVKKWTFNTHLKNCSGSLVIKKTQVKITVRYCNRFARIDN